MQSHSVHHAFGRSSFKIRLATVLRLTLLALLLPAAIPAVSASPLTCNLKSAYLGAAAASHAAEGILLINRRTRQPEARREKSYEQAGSPVISRSDGSDLFSAAAAEMTGANKRTEQTALPNGSGDYNQDLGKHLFLGVLTCTILFSTFRFSRKFATSYPIPKT
jgi:hypothetical protein